MRHKNAPYEDERPGDCSPGRSFRLLFDPIPDAVVQYDIAEELMLETVFYVSGVNILSCHQILYDRLCNKAFQYTVVRECILHIGVHLFFDTCDCVYPYALRVIESYFSFLRALILVPFTDC